MLLEWYRELQAEHRRQTGYDYVPVALRGTCAAPDYRPTHWLRALARCVWPFKVWVD